MAETAVEQGATMINYMPVTGLIKKDGFVRGVTARDEETGETYTLDAKVVVNATGPFTDNIRRMEDAAAKPMISPSQGVHIVLEKSFLPGDTAIMVPHTDDGRRTEVVITESGRMEVFHLLAPMFSALAAVDARLSTEERTAVDAFLRGVIDAMRQMI